MPRIIHRCLLLGTLLAAAGTAAAGQVLFDASQGNKPSDQGSLFFCSGPPGPPTFCGGPDGTQTVVADGVELDSTTIPAPDENTGLVGYANSPLALAAPLDRMAGFTLDFALRVDFESHASVDRAGFSVIVISDDRQGIEIGFWEDEVWAQNSGFTHGEGTPFDTGATLENYSLNILGGMYTLSAGGMPLLNGALRDYSARGNPYDVANFLFFGDDTTRARAVVTLGDIALVPLPAGFALFAPALAALWINRRRQRLTPP